MCTTVTGAKKFLGQPEGPFLPWKSQKIPKSLARESPQDLQKISILEITTTILQTFKYNGCSNAMEGVDSLLFLVCSTTKQIENIKLSCWLQHAQDGLFESDYLKKEWREKRPSVDKILNPANYIQF